MFASYCTTSFAAASSYTPPEPNTGWGGGFEVETATFTLGLGRYTIALTADETAEAIERFETIAADQEAGRLDNERQLIELEIKMLESKPRTEAENSRLEYLKQRRALIEARLLDASKKV